MSNDNTPSTAAQIMANPAVAAGAPQAPVLSSPHIKDEGIANLLENLPGLVGAIDHAIKDMAGKPYAFMLMVFTPEGAMHACNGNADVIQAAMIGLVEDWKKTGRGEEQEIRVPQATPAANESQGDGATGD